jgi:CheY-like chemotaxis protein
MEETASRSLPGGPIRVLLVDDEIADMDRTFVRGLRQQGWEVETTASPVQARERLERGADLDVVITDMVMPDGDESGLHVIDAANRADPALRIIVLTARGTPATAFASGRRGVRAYVDKMDPENDPEDQLTFLVPILAKECRRIRAIRTRLATGGLDADAILAALDLAKDALARFSSDLDQVTAGADRQRIEAVLGSGREAEAAGHELLAFLEHLVRQGLELEE